MPSTGAQWYGLDHLYRKKITLPAPKASFHSCSRHSPWSLPGQMGCHTAPGGAAVPPHHRSWVHRACRFPPAAISPRHCHYLQHIIWEVLLTVTWYHGAGRGGVVGRSTVSLLSEGSQNWTTPLKYLHLTEKVIANNPETSHLLTHKYTVFRTKSTDASYATRGTRAITLNLFYLWVHACMLEEGC